MEMGEGVRMVQGPLSAKGVLKKCRVWGTRQCAGARARRCCECAVEVLGEDACTGPVPGVNRCCAEKRSARQFLTCLEQWMFIVV